MHVANSASSRFRGAFFRGHRQQRRACRRLPLRCLLGVAVLCPAATATATCQEPPALMTATGKQVLIDTIATLVEHRFVLAERAPAFADSLRARLAAGSYDTLATPAAFADAVTSDLRAITGDAHVLLRVVEPSDVGEEAQSPLHHPVRLFRLSQREHLGFAKLEWMDGNIGYLDLIRCYPISVSKELVDGAMRFLAGADAVIIDLRENGGGDGGSLQYLTRYFLPYPTQLTSYYSRASDFLTEFWTVKDVGAPRLPDVPLFLLTSERTFSAAEMFAYDMKVQGRATLVGAATRGGAHSVDLFPLDDRFEIYISTERAINPMTNGNWEGTGVIPDVAVSADVALDTALVLARSAGRVYRAPRDSALAAAVQQMEGALARAERAFRDGRDAEGNAALDDLVRVGAAQGLANDFFLSTLAYNYDPHTDASMLLGLLRKTVERFPRSVDARVALGTTLERLGETQSAKAEFTKALELDPGNRNVQRKLKALEGR